MLPRWLLVSSMPFALGCAAASRDRRWVNDELKQRTGHGIRTSDDDTRGPELPPGVSLADGSFEFTFRQTGLPDDASGWLASVAAALRVPAQVLRSFQP